MNARIPRLSLRAMAAPPSLCERAARVLDTTAQAWGVPVRPARFRRSLPCLKPRNPWLAGAAFAI